jgi:malonyl-CoA O-methyltransferase
MAADPRFPAPDPRDVDPRAVKRAFGRAAATYDAAAVLQREVATRLAERLTT